MIDSSSSNSLTLKLTENRKLDYAACMISKVQQFPASLGSDKVIPSSYPSIAIVVNLEAMEMTITERADIELLWNGQLKLELDLCGDANCSG